jgi:uncharacterized repeat protein (TIGR02543 family)
MTTAREVLSRYASQAQLETYFVSVLGIISVKSYGALGDGHTDDSVAITAALAALSTAGGKSLYFPTGVYKVDNVTVTASSFNGLFLWGDNSSFTGISLTINQFGESALSVLSTEGDTLYRGPAADTKLPIGTAGQILAVNSGATAPEWIDSTQSVMANPGDILYTDENGDQAALPKGTTGQVMTMKDDETGPEWADGIKAVLTIPGDIGYIDAGGTFVRLPKSFSDYVLAMKATGGLPQWRQVDTLLDTKILRMPLVAYNALVSKDAKTLYFCTATGGQYLLTYDANTADGGRAPDYTYRVEDEYVDVEANTFTKTGHTFDSWNTQANGGGTTWYPSDTFQMAAADLTLYAQWT